MPDFSPSFERYVQGVERRETPRRQRIRRINCVLPECNREVRRANKFPVCTEHLLQIWKLVDGEADLTGRGYHADATGSEPDITTITVEEQEAQRLAKRQKQRELAATTGWLYVLDTRDGLVKIGWTSRDLWDRIAQYPPTFRLITQTRGSRTDERDLHRSLRLSRVKGREWYEVTPEVVRLINLWISIENTSLAQRTSDRRNRALERQNQTGMIFPVDRRALEYVPQFKPKFVSLDEWRDPDQATKTTGTEPEGYFRA
jgi:hypothetical protein